MDPSDLKSILVIRLGAMGDIIHALPAVASLKMSFPNAKLSWVVADRWVPLLEGNPYIDELILFNRSGTGAIRESWRRLRGLKPDVAIDFQGLFQSAVAGRVAQPSRFFGFDTSVAREPLAAVFYSHRIRVTGPHRVQRNLQLVRAAGASQLTEDAWLPTGEDQRDLPSQYVLASPFAGWNSKQWPLQNYDRLAESLRKEGLDLVLNVPESQLSDVSGLKHARVHSSSISGLIAATRRAAAVVGLDSGPLHLAAALHKPGVAIFGPTDPAQTGPYGGSMTVLRARDAATTYKRNDRIDESMKEISPEQVKDALIHSLVNGSGLGASAGRSAGTVRQV